MTELTNRTIHLDRIGYALAAAKEAFLHSSRMEDDQKAIRALVVEFGRNIRDLVGVCTAEFGDDADLYLDGIENVINDDVDNTFTDAIAARDLARELRRDPTERGYSMADAKRQEERA